MPITTAKELAITMLSELRHGAERSQKVYDELGQAAQNPEIKEALEARGIISSQVLAGWTNASISSARSQSR